MSDCVSFVNVGDFLAEKMRKIWVKLQIMKERRESKLKKKNKQINRIYHLGDFPRKLWNNFSGSCRIITRDISEITDWELNYKDGLSNAETVSLERPKLTNPEWI